jgi:hypothetical protein
MCQCVGLSYAKEKEDTGLIDTKYSRIQELTLGKTEFHYQNTILFLLYIALKCGQGGTKAILDIPQLLQGCNVHLTTKPFDSQFSPVTSTSLFTNVWRQKAILWQYHC